MSQDRGQPGAPQRLGKYEVQAEIGRGGMGIVYRGYDSLLDRPVAIKVLAPHLVWEPGFVERFLREARTAARLKHAGIVAIYDVGQQGNDYYIVMEYLEGQTLSNLIRQQGALPTGQALAILQPLAAALDFAHQQGLVHRDVKPSNVVVHPGGHVTLTDFGVARAAHETRLTTTGALVGTPQYMSPEQAQGEEVDHRTDIYSLGVVAYETLAGQGPFDATTPHAVLHRVIYDPPPPVRARHPDLPPEIDDVLATALAKEPASRYQTAGEFVGDLEAAVTGRPARPREAPGPVAAPVPPRSTRRAVARPASRPAARPQALPAPGRGFGLVWFVASALASMAGWALGIQMAEAVGRALGPIVDIALLEAAAGAASWGAVGLLVGLAQWLLLRRHLRGMWRWVVATVAGFVVVGSIKWAQGLLVEPIMHNVFSWLEEIDWEEMGFALGIVAALITEGLTGLLIGLAQWLALQDRVVRAARWLSVSSGAWAGAGLLLSSLTAILGPLEEETGFWVAPLIANIVVAAITALGAVWILSDRKKDAQT